MTAREADEPLPAECGHCGNSGCYLADEGYPPNSKDPFPKAPPHFVIGGRYKFDPAEVKAWREERRGAA